MTALSRVFFESQRGFDRVFADWRQRHGVVAIQLPSMFVASETSFKHFEQCIINTFG